VNSFSGSGFCALFHLSYLFQLRAQLIQFLGIVLFGFVPKAFEINTFAKYHFRLIFIYNNFVQTGHCSQFCLATLDIDSFPYKYFAIFIVKKRFFYYYYFSPSLLHRLAGHTAWHAGHINRTSKQIGHQGTYIG
jgi:hypothetical protein